MSQEQVELEFRDEIATTTTDANAGTTEPTNGSTDANADAKMTQKIEARKAQLIAEMMEEFMKEEKKLLHNLTMILLQN